MMALGGTSFTASAQKALSRAQSEALAHQLTEQRKESIRQELAREWNAKELINGEYKMLFWDTIYGPAQAPAGGRSMIISMHGGGNTTPAANDQQWLNQTKLYTPEEALYFVPRSPTNSWNMWHQEYMDEFLRKAIAAAVLFENVNPDKVYITGYSAGGDGTYQMAPRMADHWAAAAMMAGHPGDARAENLRNLPFAIYMGGQDAAYDRNHLAREWGTKLQLLSLADNGGYIHEAQIYEDCGHWMLRKDTVAIPWMAQFTRNLYPEKVVWIQDDVLRTNFYWVGVPEIHRRKGAKIVAKIIDQNLYIEQSDSPVVLIGLNDQLIDLDKTVNVYWNGHKIDSRKWKRTAASLEKSLDDSPYSLDAPYPVILKIEENGNAKAGATVVAY